jgi:ankyrin repeat protein
MRSTTVRLVLAVLVLFGPAATGTRLIAGPSLFDALRRNDLTAVNALVAQGADVNAADATGATPLMYAALYAGPECLTALIDRGASVNAANAYGSTPLMRAAARTENVKLLVRRGADVNARASDDVTAVVATARYSNVDAMQFLIASGADTRSQTTRTDLLTAAYFATTPAIRDALRSAGIVVKSNADVKGPVLNRSRGDLAALASLLDAGIDPNEQVPLITLSLPSFFLAAREGQLSALKAFVKAGIDPIVSGPKGWTALMLAAGSDTPNTAVMQYLLDRGADVNAVDEDGKSALDWALTRGETEASKFLRNAGGRTAAALSPAPASRGVPRPAADAVTRAIARLQPVGPAFNNRTKCNSCHNQNIPGMAITSARRHGIATDESLATHSMDVTMKQWAGRREAVLLGDTNGGGFQANSLYTLLEMAEAHAPGNPTSDALVFGLASHQLPDGSLPLVTDIRPPLTGSTVTVTAMFIRALREYAPEGRRAEMEHRASLAAAFITKVSPRDTQEQVFKMLALLWSSAPESDVAREQSALVALQRADGGWAQMPSMSTDAFASGQALWALHAAGMQASSPVYQKGVDYLLKSQLEDGTWFVRTRAFGFQPYFETGFPHGRSQFISTVATSWAALALTATLESNTPHAQ